MNFIAAAQATPWRLVSKHPGSATWGSHRVGRNSLTMVSINRGQSSSCREIAGITNNWKHAIPVAIHTEHSSLSYLLVTTSSASFFPFSNLFLPFLVYNNRFTWMHASEECLAMWVRMCRISRTTVGTGRTTSRMYLSRCWIRVFKSPWKEKNIHYVLINCSLRSSCRRERQMQLNLLQIESIKITTGETKREVSVDLQASMLANNQKVGPTEQEHLNFCSVSDYQWAFWIVALSRVWNCK